VKKLNDDWCAMRRSTVSSAMALAFGMAALGTAVLATAVLGRPAMAATSSPIQRGKAFARANCARCHAVDRVSESPLKIAPPFRTLHLRYPIETLGEALAEGIYTGHADMPAFELDPEQIHDLLSYLKTLE
jgi:mono/diheme cytochrome c family protein